MCLCQGFSKQNIYFFTVKHFHALTAEVNDKKPVLRCFYSDDPGSDSPEILLVRTKSRGTGFRVRTNGRFSNPENSFIRKYWPGTNVSGLTNHHCTKLNHTLPKITFLPMQKSSCRTFKAGVDSRQRHSLLWTANPSHLVLA